LLKRRGLPLDVDQLRTCCRMVPHPKTIRLGRQGEFELHPHWPAIDSWLAQHPYWRERWV
jgi:hypothetical protein